MRIADGGLREPVPAMEKLWIPELGEHKPRLQCLEQARPSCEGGDAAVGATGCGPLRP
jgi:hypothetical protein